MDLGKNKLVFCGNFEKNGNKMKDKNGFRSHTKVTSHPLSTNPR